MTSILAASSAKSPLFTAFSPVLPNRVQVFKKKLITAKPTSKIEKEISSSNQVYGIKIIIFK